MPFSARSRPSRPSSHSGSGSGRESRASSTRRAQRSRASRQRQLLVDPAAQTVALQQGTGRLVVDADGQAVLVVEGLEQAPAGKTYELWIVPGGDIAAASPAGLFAGSDGTEIVRLEGTVAPGDVVAVTVEAAAGADEPTTQPIIASDPSERTLCRHIARPELESAPLRVRSEKGSPRPRRRVRKRRLAALVAVLLVAAGLSFTFGLVRAVASEIPALDPAAQHLDVDTVVYAENGRSVLAVLRGDESRVLVGTEDIAPIMRQAIVAVEDQRFYEHNGVDVRGIARALWQDVRQQGIVEGGSTITQQFVKNAYIRNEKTVARKVREAALAWQLEQDWTKDRILTAYLNTIYFGHGAYGIQQAARAYFKKGAQGLAESALLAGIPADPSLYDPAANSRSATSAGVTSSR